MLRLFLTVALMTTLAPNLAEAKRASDFTVRTQETIEANSSLLSHSEWAFTDMNGGKISARKELGVHFLDGHGFQATLCNDFSGTYSVKQGKLFVRRTDFTQTQILCNADTRTLRTNRNAIAVEHLFSNCDGGCRLALDNHILKLTGKGDTTLKLIRRDWD